MDFDDHRDTIKSRQDFVDFIQALINDKEAVSECINTDTTSYLETIAAFTSSIQNVYANYGEVFVDEPSWSLFATLLEAAMIYE